MRTLAQAVCGMGVFLPRTQPIYRPQVEATTIPHSSFLIPHSLFSPTIFRAQVAPTAACLGKPNARSVHHVGLSRYIMSPLVAIHHALLRQGTFPHSSFYLYLPTNSPSSPPYSTFVSFSFVAFSMSASTSFPSDIPTALNKRNASDPGMVLISLTYSFSPS